ncbi:MAG: YjjG family noncanonical pyrimidine nucleotidase [Bacteroidia bacterium]|jgi:putative hydrolase of the HAD superfamily|nr:YjjG family noncanonical pyrimidine nucleotidase [Bacteroidia bacterium]MBP7262405.1 YjjG family noncanonical pyrimidine nucleotidase [Bacteroidia bacterium]MBP9181271.1 YjjG family noncanonical pyrimidine nucleotidase [Bacteroidia bacterium]MBP9725479.1 YjjG family noncanonical pyrimidine nucleotidase [Bacteroidia bacterium]
MAKYKHIFFDLDHTLWDFHRNSEETLHSLFYDFELHKFGVPHPQRFLEVYTDINHRLWQQYHKGEVNKAQLRDNRFRSTFKALGFDGDHLADAFSEQYLSISPTKPHLIPNAIEALEYLSGRYTMSIITNGFAEVQHTKLKYSGIEKYFNDLIISEEIGCQKPDVRIFEFAAFKAGVPLWECLMIGDNADTDIAGARNAGTDQVFFNPEKKPLTFECTYHIHDLAQLIQLL